MNSLYNIRQEHLVLLNEVEQGEGELTEELANALSITQEQFQEKGISYGFVLKTFDNSIDLIDKEIQRLTELKQQATKRQGMIKERLSKAMIEFGIEKLNNELLSLSLRKSEAVEIFNERLITEDYKDLKTVATVNKSRIKEAIKDGINVQGARIIVNKSLQIK